MPKFEITTAEMIVYKIPVEAETEDEAWDIAYDLLYGEQNSKYYHDTMDMGFPDSIEEVE